MGTPPRSGNCHNIRWCSGAKEIDIAATLEHIRDQRINMVRSKVRSCVVSVGLIYTSVLTAKSHSTIHKNK